MAPSRIADRPIQPRRDGSDNEYDTADSETDQVAEDASSDNESASDLDEPSVDGEADSDAEDGSSVATDPASEDEEQDDEEESEDLKNISFGALAKAQEAFAPPSKSRKRKLASLDTPSDASPATTIDNPHPTYDIISKKPKQDLATRSSKHAPTVLSSRNPVSRKREILPPPPVHKSRDPRFDPTITSQTLNESSIARADKAYSFLTDYQATEILALKSEIRKSQSKDPEHADTLKKKLMSMESRLRNAETKAKEREILSKHKAQEKQAIKEGKKDRPYFLKNSELKKEVQRERIEGMGKRQKDKMEKRKRMREKTKDARDMPWARRMG